MMRGPKEGKVSGEMGAAGGKEEEGAAHGLDRADYPEGICTEAGGAAR